MSDEWQKRIDFALDVVALSLGLTLLGLVWLAILAGIIQGVSR